MARFPDDLELEFEKKRQKQMVKWARFSAASLKRGRIPLIECFFNPLKPLHVFKKWFLKISQNLSRTVCLEILLKICDINSK